MKDHIRIRPKKIVFISTLIFVTSVGIKRSVEDQIDSRLTPKSTETLLLASCTITCASTCGLTNKC